jgi:hypothetical protein
MLIINRRYGFSKFGGYAFIGVNVCKQKVDPFSKEVICVLAMVVTLMDLVVHS